MTRLLKLIAEFAGTFGIVLISTAAVAMTATSPAATYSRFIVAGAYGAAYGAAIAILGRVCCGHFNPAVSVAHWVTHRMSTTETAFYVAAQIAGAICAVYALRLALPAGIASVPGPPVPAFIIMRGPAMLVEAAMTFVLVAVLWVFVVRPPRPRWWVSGIVVGAVVAIASYLGAPYTSGVMNPARAFGLAVPTKLWSFQLVYWVGPMAGAIAAATLCDLFFRRISTKAVPPSAPVPQNS